MRRRCLAMVAALAAAWSTAAAPPLPHFLPNEELAGYLDEALAAHPAIQAREAMWQAALQRIPQARSLEDPMLSYGQMLRSKAVRPEIMLSQAFPWFGTLRAKGDQAAAEAEALVPDILAARNRVVEGVKLAYFDLAWIGASAEVLRSQRDILVHTAEVVEARLALGLSMEDELLRIATERAMIEDRLAQLDQMRSAFVRRLNSAMGAPPDTARPPPMPMATPPDPPAYAELAAQLDEASPALVGYAARMDAADHAARVARLSGFPRIALGLEWTGMPDPPKERVARPRVQPLDPPMGSMKSSPTGMGGPSLGNPGGGMADSGDDEWMLSIGFTLPVWRGRVRGAVEEARQMGEALRHMRHADRLEIEAELGQVWFQLDDAKRRYALHSESIIPLTYRSFESLLARYSTGAEGGDFLPLLESVRAMLDSQLAQFEAEKDWHAAAATMERIVGGWIPAAQAAEPVAIAPLDPEVDTP